MTRPSCSRSTSWRPTRSSSRASPRTTRWAWEGEDGDAIVTPALAQALEAEAAPDDPAAAESEVEEPVEAEALALADPDEIEEISLEEVDEPDDVDDDEEPEV